MLLSWIIALLAIGLALIVAEIFLPAWGILGGLGAVALLAAVGVCYRLEPWMSLAMLLAMVALTPLVWRLALRIWPKTPIGRRLLLPEVENTAEPLPFQIGQEGTAISELKPMGECQFGARRVAARSRQGIIHPGTRVTVVSADGRTATVQEAPVSHA
jgi:membrane-bound ClpP family serine protease